MYISSRLYLFERGPPLLLTLFNVVNFQNMNDKLYKL